MTSDAEMLCDSLTIISLWKESKHGIFHTHIDKIKLGLAHWKTYFLMV